MKNCFTAWPYKKLKSEHNIPGFIKSIMYTSVEDSTVDAPQCSEDIVTDAEYGTFEWIVTDVSLTHTSFQTSFFIKKDHTHERETIGLAWVINSNSEYMV